MLAIGSESVFENLSIPSPKRNPKLQTGWEGFFPYYAGFPESFARSAVTGINLPNDAVIYDPWNGSGTTTYVASTLGVSSIGFDLNPVMVIVAKSAASPFERIGQHRATRRRNCEMVS